MALKTKRDWALLLGGSLLLFFSLLVHSSSIAYAATILFFLFALFNHKTGVLLLLIYFPIRPMLLELNPALKAVGDLIILGLTIKVIYLKRDQLNNLIKFHVFEWAFFLFCIVGAVSALITNVSPTAILFQLRAFLITYLLFFVVKHLDISKREVQSFLWVTFCMAVILSLHGLVEKISIRSWLLPEAWVNKNLSATNSIRIYGLIGNPNVLAYYLGISTMLSMYLRKLTEGKLRDLINVGIVLMVGVLLLTYSRGTMIALSITLIIYIVVSKNFRVLRVGVICLITAIIFVFYPTNMAVDYVIKHSGDSDRTHADDTRDLDRYANTFDEKSLEQSMNGGRLYVVKKGFEIFQDHPIIGTGFGTFGDSATHAYGSPVYKKYNIPSATYADNQYIEIIVQTGSVGVVLFAVFLLGMLWKLWRWRFQRGLSIILLSILIGVYVSALYYNIWEDKTFTTYYFIMLGVLFSQNKKETSL